MSEPLDEDTFHDLMELTQLKAGHVLTEANAAAIQALFEDWNAETQAHGDAYERGVAEGRLNAAGAEVSALLATIDELRGRIVVEKSMARFYRKLGEKKRRGEGEAP